MVVNEGGDCSRGVLDACDFAPEGDCEPVKVVLQPVFPGALSSVFRTRLGRGLNGFTRWRCR